ncbi:glycosyltransferase family 2 protein [Terriglobus roseus]|uniref:Glycosyltransferase, GT2 family n=1 Tax=Terriglobus roseus TaxID=392734 RepID=A0A1H4J123_9BACT|nr:glycosyltransferase family 2 protein [Terriglobus roseus]SEB39318.1 Glycosyltransferase, GT2 family [Terriglobus roseus]
MMTYTEEHTMPWSRAIAPYRIAVLVTCHNRCELTLMALRSLHQQQGIDDVEMKVFLVDDGSTDGTADAVRKLFPEVCILQGCGNLFWNGGMRTAFAEALKGDFDAYLWFNDDTILYRDAMSRVVACAREASAHGKPAIVAGSTVSPATGEHSYGGFQLHAHGLVLEFEKIKPHTYEVMRCDTVNGNFTLIPREVAKSVGNIEPGFRHQFGDVDYGLRAKRMGFDLMVAPGYVGQCTVGNPEGTWKDASAPMRKRWKNLMSPKGVPFTEWLLFTRRHYGWRWMHYALSPYARTLVSSLVTHR